MYGFTFYENKVCFEKNNCKELIFLYTHHIQYIYRYNSIRIYVYIIYDNECEVSLSIRFHNGDFIILN